MYKRYEAEPERYIAENDFYERVRSDTILIAEFKPSEKPTNSRDQLNVLVDYLTNLASKTKTSNTTGPTIQIYRIP
jgi:truncated hemoglobin YjbI